MQQQRRADHARREMIRLCHAGHDSRTLRSTLLTRLRGVIPFESSCFITADPATLLFTGSVVDELAAATPQLIENELLHDDVNKFAWLARRTPPVSGLIQATQGEPVRSRRYREILAPQGIGDELRAALLSGTNCWGFLCLHRGRSGPPFSAAEGAYLARLTPHFAAGLRTALLLSNTAGLPGRSSTTAPTASDEPGLLLLAEDLSVLAITPAAERWLAEVGATDWPRTEVLPPPITAVVARLRVLEQGQEAPPERLPRVRLRTASGKWLVLHAARLAGPQAHGQIAVILEVARPVEVAPLIGQAYDLTKRESEVLQSVVRGHSTAEIAATFSISSHTVQDHLKAIFAKVGVRSRRELVGQLFAEHYQPAIAAGRPVDRNGWFNP